MKSKNQLIDYHFLYLDTMEDGKKLTTLQKLGGVLLGAAALFGALMLINFIRQRRAAVQEGAVGGAAAQEGAEVDDVVVAEQAAKSAESPVITPCTVAGVPGTLPAVQEWFPGSYVPFSQVNSGCLDDPRNKRC